LIKKSIVSSLFQEKVPFLTPLYPTNPFPSLLVDVLMPLFHSYLFVLSNLWCPVVGRGRLLAVDYFVFDSRMCRNQHGYARSEVVRVRHRSGNSLSDSSRFLLDCNFARVIFLVRLRFMWIQSGITQKLNADQNLDPSRKI
jgi:hypothetical protein